MTLYEFLKPISPFLTIRLFVDDKNERGGYKEIFNGVKENIPIMYLSKAPKFVTISFKEHILNIDLN